MEMLTVALLFTSLLNFHYLLRVSFTCGKLLSSGPRLIKNDFPYPRARRIVHAETTANHKIETNLKNTLIVLLSKQEEH